MGHRISGTQKMKRLLQSKKKKSTRLTRALSKIGREHDLK